MDGVLGGGLVVAPHRLAAAAVVLDWEIGTVLPSCRGMFIMVVMMDGATALS